MELFYIILIFGIFMLVRNEWVYKKRMSIIKETSSICQEKINELHSCGNLRMFDVGKFYKGMRNVYWDYDKMVLHFWIWDINKMRNE